ncbi:MAG TPA: hypothetical protein VIJ75_00670 [Hanamia sp.]
MKKISFLIFLFIASTAVNAQLKTTLTDSLVQKFGEAWNENNLNKMISLIQPDAFFKSPYQMNYSRDTMAATVLITNPRIIRNTKTIELYSKVDDNIAWSIGKLSGSIFDEKGNDTGKMLSADYIYVFTKKKNEGWKIQMIIVHEK